MPTAACSASRAREIPPPSPTVVPVLHVDIMTGGHPELSCVKGVFSGLRTCTRRCLGGVRTFIGTSFWPGAFNVPTPAAARGARRRCGSSRLQYRYQNAPFGQMSQPVSVTVRG